MDGPAARGHTLIELLCLLAVAAALAAWAVPALRDLRLNSARTVAVNGFVQAVHLARSEALKRNRVVSLCPSRDGRRCASGAGWSEGMGLESALTLAVSQLAKDHAGGPDRVLGPDQLEVAVLDRHRPRRTFRRIVGAALANLLGDLVASARVDGGASDADATGSAKATEVHANPGDSPRQTATNPQTQRPNQDDAHHGDADDHDAADVHGTDS